MFYVPACAQIDAFWNSSNSESINLITSPKNWNLELENMRRPQESLVLLPAGAVPPKALTQFGHSVWTYVPEQNRFSILMNWSEGKGINILYIYNGSGNVVLLLTCILCKTLLTPVSSSINRITIFYLEELLSRVNLPWGTITL